MRGRRQILELNHRTAGARATYLRVAGVVSQMTGVPVGAIVDRQKPWRPNRARNNPVSFARQAAIYLTVVACDVRQGALARAIERPRTRILDACRRGEEMRDDPRVDQFFDRLEAML